MPVVVDPARSPQSSSGTGEGLALQFLRVDLELPGWSNTLSGSAASRPRRPKDGLRRGVHEVRPRPR